MLSKKEVLKLKQESHELLEAIAKHPDYQQAQGVQRFLQGQVRAYARVLEIVGED